MRSRLLLLAIAVGLTGLAAAQSSPCSCGAEPVARPAKRTMKPYAEAPEDLRPFSKFTTPYYENYSDTIEYNGAARDLPVTDPKDVTEIRIGFLAPLSNHPDEAFGQRMLHGAQLALDQRNAAGGYCGRPFKLMLHNDSATWGASSNEVVKMVYDDKVWAMFGSISGDTTHIALRVALRAETPLVNSASTDPTIPETIIPWYFTDLQDDRVQGYTLARRIYTEVGLKRVALLRVNDRYGRFGVGKFRDASRRLGHPVVIEQKFVPGSTDFTHQLKVIADSRADGIVLWTDQAQAAKIVLQMRELGMTQKVFGSHRTMGEQFVKLAGPAAEGVEAVFPYDPTREDRRWKDFNAAYAKQYGEAPEQFASLAYDAMQVLLNSICRAGLNRALIRDVLTATEHYDGVTGAMHFDPNCKNISPLFLAKVVKGHIEYRRATMEKAYANVNDEAPQYRGPAIADSKKLKIAVFGTDADKIATSEEMKKALGDATLVVVPADGAWGKSSTQLVDAIYKQDVVGIIALDRNASHLAEQLGVKAFVPVIALSDDKTLTSVNIPWIFRLPKGADAVEAVRLFEAAVKKSGLNRQKIREALAAGELIAGLTFEK
jgi:branched-chain amino acid transport system substrate-binding protein